MRYLRVEALNLSNTLFDTDKMNVIRGGSLMLRDAILSASVKLCALHISEVRVGAEAAVFRLNSDQPTETEVISSIRSILANKAPHFIFAVVVANAENDADGIARTAAVARWQQMRQLRVIPDRPAAAAEITGICEFTRVRAANKAGNSSVTGTLCTSARKRAENGRELRQTFYEQEADAEVAKGLNFSSDLNDLSISGPYPTVDGKMAVLSIDGNSFGKTVAALTTEKASAFDKHMKGLRRQLLTRVLTFMKQKEAHSGERRRDNRLRLEILLWAGDEFKLILPAWLGVPVLHQIFDEIRNNWRTGPDSADSPLTVSAGVLMCHHKMPIVRALELADSLQQSAKHAAKPEGRSLRNAWDYLVLESLDYPAAMRVDDYWKRRLGNAKPPLALLPCLQYDHARSELEQALSESDSRRKVYASAQLLANPGAMNRVETEEWQKNPAAAKVLAAMRLLLPASAEEPAQMHWLRLRELWDYLLPRPGLQPEPAPISTSETPT